MGRHFRQPVSRWMSSNSASFMKNKSRFDIRVSAAACVLAILAGCGGSLDVKPIGQLGADDSKSIPFYLPKHDFVVSDLRLDANGSEVSDDRKGLEVSLVTRRDLDRGFLVKNNAGIFSDSEFSISRDVRGRLTAVTGKSADKTLETVQALATFVGAAAGGLASGKLADQAQKDELVALKEAKKKLVTALEDAQTPQEIRTIQQAHALVVARIAKVSAAIKGAAGVKAFGFIKPVVEVCANDADRIERLSTLKNTKKEGVYVLLIAAEGPKGSQKCSN